MERTMKTIIISAAASGVPVNLLRFLVRRWQKQIARLRDPYRPERHYMRGPGPKWREKHGLVKAHSDCASFVV
jgi:hypothetical protein